MNLVIPTGIEGLDAVLHGGYQPGSLTVVAGGTASGKTTFLCRAIQSALNQNGVVVIYDLETPLLRYHHKAGGASGLGQAEGFRDLNNLSELSQMVPQPDLVVFDAIHLHAVLRDRHALESTSLARWMVSSFLPLIMPLPAAKIVSWQFAALDSGIPRGLGYSAHVVMRLDRNEAGDVGVRITKNRFGVTLDRLILRMPDLRPIVRKSIWERLDEDS
jgi:hypothetical protein